MQVKHSTLISVSELKG